MLKGYREYQDEKIEVRRAMALVPEKVLCETPAHLKRKKRLIKPGPKHGVWDKMLWLNSTASLKKLKQRLFLLQVTQGHEHHALYEDNHRENHRTICKMIAVCLILTCQALMVWMGSLIHVNQEMASGIIIASISIISGAILGTALVRWSTPLKATSDKDLLMMRQSRKIRAKLALKTIFFFALSMSVSWWSVVAYHNASPLNQTLIMGGFLSLWGGAFGSLLSLLLWHFYIDIHETYHDMELSRDVCKRLEQNAQTIGHPLHEKYLAVVEKRELERLLEPQAVHQHVKVGRTSSVLNTSILKEEAEEAGKARISGMDDEAVSIDTPHSLRASETTERPSPARKRRL